MLHLPLQFAIVQQLALAIRQLFGRNRRLTQEVGCCALSWSKIKVGRSRNAGQILFKQTKAFFKSYSALLKIVFDEGCAR
jgi:hypothetical protein